MDVVPNPNAGAQDTPDESQQTPVSHLAGDAGHEHIVRDLVEAFLQIQIHNNAVALAGPALNLPECSVRTASGTKAEARLGEVRVEDRREDLLDGLRDQPIENGRYPEQANPSAHGLRDLYPPHGLRRVAAVQQGLTDGGPMLPREGHKVVDGHAVHAGGTPVGLHLFARHGAGCSGPPPVASDSSCKAGCVDARRIPAPPVGLIAECELPTAPPCLIVFWPSAPDPGGVRCLLCRLLTSARSRQGLPPDALPRLCGLLELSNENAKTGQDSGDSWCSRTNYFA